MASVSIRKETNTLYLDFRYMGKRCREQTTLKPTLANRKNLERVLVQIESEIVAGTFRYKTHFPNSKSVEYFTDLELQTHLPDEWKALQEQVETPFFEEFVEGWIDRNKVAWRRSHIINIESIVSKHYLPFFGKMKVDDITRNDILKFRTSLAKVPGRNGKESLANTRINKIVNPLKRIFEDAADEYNFTTPYIRIKPLKSPKTDAFPFTIEEVNLILDTVRPHY